MTAAPPIVLGIETSCDETAAAVLRGDRRILSSVVLSQVALHEVHGGVVPEIAARAHLDHCDEVVRRAIAGSGVGWSGIDAVAATLGPGLIGGLVVGAMTGKAIAGFRLARSHGGRCASPRWSTRWRARCSSSTTSSTRR